MPAVLTAEIAPSLPFERATDLYATMLPLGCSDAF